MSKLSRAEGRGLVSGGDSPRCPVCGDWLGFGTDRQGRAVQHCDCGFKGYVQRRSGSVIELRGDEALAVFSSARQAVAAAVDLQERLVDETIDEPELPMPAGIGLDAGEGVPLEGGYRGMDPAATVVGSATSSLWTGMTTSSTGAASTTSRALTGQPG